MLAPCSYLQLEYLLCYGAVGFEFQMHYLERGDAGVRELSGVFDTSRALDRIHVIHAAILTHHLICLQAAALRRACLPLRHGLESDFACADGSRIVFGDRHVMKLVPRAVFESNGVKFEDLVRLYVAVQGSKHVVHAVHGPLLKRDVYQVHLEPVGEEVPQRGPAAAEVKTAIRSGTSRFATVSDC